MPLSDVMDQISATEALGCRWVPIRRLRKTSVIVVGHTYRGIYNTSPSRKLKNIENLPRSRDPREPKPCPWMITTRPNLGPSAKDLAYICTNVHRWSIAVVRYTYRGIYITSPYQNLKNLEICLQRPPGAKTLPLGDHYQTKPRSKR